MRKMDSNHPKLSALLIDGADDDVGDDSVRTISTLSDLTNLHLRAPNFTDAGLRHIVTLPKLTNLHIGSSRVTGVGFEGWEDKGIESLTIGEANVDDNGLRIIAKITSLHTLRLGRMKITDAGLVYLGRTEPYGTISLIRTNVTDAGVMQLLSSASMQELSIDETEITDQTLLAAAKHGTLKGISVTGTKVTAEGVARFKAARPDCIIYWEPPSSSGATEPTLVAEPVKIEEGEPISRTAYVTKPPKLPGVLSWTIVQKEAETSQVDGESTCYRQVQTASQDAFLVASGTDGSTHVWERTTGYQGAIALSSGYFTLSPDGQSLAESRREKPVVAIWDLKSMKRRETIDALNNCRLAYSQDGKLLAAATNTSLTIYDVGARKIVDSVDASLALNGRLSMQWSADGKYVFTSGFRLPVRVFEVADMANPTVFYRDYITTEPYFATTACWLPQSSILVHQATGRSPIITDFNSTRETTVKQWEPDGHNLVCSPDGRYLAAVARGNLSVYDLKAKKEVVIDNPVPAPFVSGFSADSKRIIIGGQRVHGEPVGVGNQHFALQSKLPEPVARVWDTQTREQVTALVGLPKGDYLIVSADGHYVGRDGIEDKIVYVIQTAEGRETLTPKQFAERFDWKNDNDKVRLLE